MPEVKRVFFMFQKTMEMSAIKHIKIHKPRRKSRWKMVQTVSWNMEVMGG